MKDNDFYIPKFLDEPERFLFWTLDEALALVAPMILGVIVGHTIIGLSIGLVAMLVLRKLKSSGGSKVIKSWLYWHLPSNLIRTKGTPPSYIREYGG